ncbi:hypothetical protein BU23DRAFT_133125 [Bimuria novae-zelandiae CBS 107.79]|uniref:Uncharacterized protein n=1 Tax=Bimuria novae-zelandiae CBS 107.79 TaxID=1447943 RepID=A0A6A5VA64_9PLEO|nr:hypothetical protein BU23DRAFT_133125 [Bimuria novae-zelandiae CBS 107.79]
MTRISPNAMLFTPPCAWVAQGGFAELGHVIIPNPGPAVDPWTRASVPAQGPPQHPMAPHALLQYQYLEMQIRKRDARLSESSAKGGVAVDFGRSHFRLRTSTSRSSEMARAHRNPELHSSIMLRTQEML